MAETERDSIPSGSGDGATSRFPVAGLGASAGGLEALAALIGRLTPDRMAFIVLQHLAPAHESLLPEILARGSSLPVVTAADGARVEPGTIYVAPPGVDVTLEGGALQLLQPADQLPRHSIDRLFRSMAHDLGQLAIGVVLSGVGSDGTLGLREIKAEGGIAIAQDPSTAAQSGMPQSGIDAGCVDFCLTPSEIGDELMRLAAHPFVARKSPGLGEAGRSHLLARLREAYGVDFSAYKLNTIERRIERRMALQKVDTVEDYLAIIRGNSDELDLLYSDLLIGVTAFFRDREPFELLKTVVFPRIFERRTSDSPVRIWVPGCSTGEEAFTIAMCLFEYLDGRPSSHKLQIFATDIDDRALTVARHAVYPKNLVADLSAERLQRFFTRQDDGYQVARQLRDVVVFAHHNLGKDPPFSKLDLISCRNVLIYMQPSLQHTMLRSLHYALNPDAFLLLGSSESVGDAADLFSLVDRKLKLYTKKNIASAAVFEFSAGRTAVVGEHAPTTPPPKRLGVSVQQLADRKILDRFGPPSVLVDHKLDVVQFRGNTGSLLAPAPGDATLNIFKLIRPELSHDLRIAIAEASKTTLPVETEPVRVGASAIVIEVIPIRENADARSSLLVLFREVTAALPPPRAPEEPTELRVRELERELLVTKEYLQTSVQELQSSNEELQSSNEELQSSNEELQSTNEELETSKEELQSTNEELSTVNEELQNRMSQLATSNDDLQNVMSMVGVALVIVGMDLRIRRFSTTAEKLLNLIAGDVGRPVAYLATALNAPQLEALVADTIKGMHERAQRVQCSDGQFYTLRACPYRTAEHAIHGAVLELVKVPPGHKLGELPEVQELAGKVLSTLPDVLVLLDDKLRVLWVNRAFFETFLVGAEIVGRPVDALWSARANAELWTALEDAAAGRRGFDDLKIAGAFGRENLPEMSVSARCIPAEQDRSALTLVMIKKTEGRTA